MIGPHRGEPGPVPGAALRLRPIARRARTGRSVGDAVRDFARMIRKHFDGIVAWIQTRQTNGFIEALNGLFQAAKRKARGYTRFATMRTVIFLIAGKLDFTPVNPYAE